LGWFCRFFFSNRRVIYHQYKEFFGVEEQSEREGDEGVEDTPQIPPQEATARFYLTLLYTLAKKDITKIEEVEKLPLYLCLNISAMIKEQRDREEEEYRKMKSQMKNN